MNSGKSLKIIRKVHSALLCGSGWYTATAKYQSQSQCIYLQKDKSLSLWMHAGLV